MADNTDLSLLASSVRTTATTSADQTNPGLSGGYFILNISAASGTGGLTLRVQGKDPVSGTYYNLNAAPPAILATGIYIYGIGPGFTTTGGDIQQTTALPLPKTWRISIAVGDSSSYTYSVGAETAG